MPVFKAAVLFDSTNAALGFKLGRSKRWSRSDSGPCSSAAAVVSASPSPSRKASPASCAVSLENVNANVNAPRVGACASSSTSSPSFSSSSVSSSSPSAASHSRSSLNFIPFPSSGDQDQVVRPDHRHREISQPDLSSNMAPRSSTAGCLDLLRRASPGTSPASSLSSQSSPASATQQDRDRRKRVNARLPPATLPRKRPRLGQERQQQQQQQQQRSTDDTSPIGPRSDPAAAHATTPRPAQRRPLFADPHEVRFTALVQRSVARSASCAGNAALVAQDRLLASRLHALLVARGCRKCLLIDVDVGASADAAMDVDAAALCSVKQDSASPASVRPSDVDVEMADVPESASPRSSPSPPLATPTECTLAPSQLVACLLMRHRCRIGRAPGLRRSGCASSASCDGSVAPWSPRISSPLAREIAVRV